MVEQAFNLLIEIQEQADRRFFQQGLFPSERKYSLFGIKRPDDNVYFTAYILHILKEHQPFWEQNNKKSDILSLIKKAEQSLKVYQHGKDDLSFNYYRANGFFPNGWLLHRHKHFKPANDSDDSSIAFLGLDFDIQTANALQKKIAYHANGKRNRWVKRIPKEYRHFKTYNTWLGTDKLYVDLDFGVLCNILQFVAKYKLDITSYEIEAVRFLEQAVLSKDYLNKSTLISAWYPEQAVVLYFISRVIKTGYYNFSTNTLIQLQQDTVALKETATQPIQNLLLETALYNLGIQLNDFNISLDKALSQQDFSIGVVPIAQPWNNEWAQKLGGLPFLQMTYHCKAFEIALWLERAFITHK